METFTVLESKKIAGMYSMLMIWQRALLVVGNAAYRKHGAVGHIKPLTPKKKPVTQPKWKP